MSLVPNFVLWAAISCTLLLIAGTIAWLVLHGPLLRALRRLWLSDLVAGWLAYAAGYHLAFLGAYRPLLGREAYALWALLGALGLYAALRVLPTPLQRRELLFALALVTWGGVIAAGQRYVDETAQDAALLGERPAAVLTASAPDLRPLRRALVLTRLDEGNRAAVQRTLAMLTGTEPADAALLSAFRIARTPLLEELFARDLAKLRTYQWLQIALLAMVLLLWGFGRTPEWATL